MGAADRFVVNAAIEYLISGEEEEWIAAAKTVIDFGRSIPSIGGLYIIERFEFDRSGSDEHIEGYASGIGNVEIESGKKPEVKRSISAKEERVGYYRLMHDAEQGVLMISHYRESGSFRSLRSYIDEGREGYLLSYDEGGEPALFFEEVYVASRPPLRVRLMYLLRRMGTTLRCCLTGRMPPKLLICYFVRRARVIHSARPWYLPGMVLNN